ncbi:MAG: hypothetical protein ACFCUQ_16015 [Kiloniellales bacterium]
MTALLAATLLSFAVWLLALALGFDEPPAYAPDAYKTYFQQVNWWPVPFIFLGLAPGIWLTWRPMLQAWSRLAETGVLRGPEGQADEAAVQRVLRFVRRWRGSAILAALVAALVINAVDWAPRYDVYLGSASLAKQLGVACRFPNASVKWLLEADLGGGDPCSVDAEQGLPEARIEGIAPPPGQLLFNLVLVAQQFLITLFAALAVTQILLHTFLFGAFEQLAVARAQGLRLMLNCQSPLNEFGLEHWNFALNNFYWAVSPALLGVFLSRVSTPPEDYLPGQVILGFAVPACLLAPMIATILVRQARLPDAWATLQPNDPVAAEDYRRQQLWPLDRNWSSKLGIVLAFALAALSIGFEVTQLVRL